MQDPVRAKKADRWDALVAQGMSGSEAQAQVEREFLQQAAETPTLEAPRDLTVGEQVVGAVRQAANAATFGQYPRMVGAVNRMLGRDDEDAAKLGQYMAEYKQRAPGQAAVARFAGDVVPYMTGPGATRGVGRLAQGVGRMVNPQATGRVAQALSAASQTAGKAYRAARTAPGVGAVASRVLPTSAANAARRAGAGRGRAGAHDWRGAGRGRQAGRCWSGGWAHR
jgi:hypothetical protein